MLPPVHNASSVIHDRSCKVESGYQLAVRERIIQGFPLLGVQQPGTVDLGGLPPNHVSAVWRSELSSIVEAALRKL